MAVAKKNMIDVGEAVGIIAAQSIGEPGTQMSLHRDEKVIVRQEGEVKIVKIGEFIDSAFSQYGHVTEEGHEICDLPAGAGMEVPSLMCNEKIEWRGVSALSRHKSPAKLLRIRLRSGREITATPYHSFVIRKDNEIVAVSGASLEAGDRLPVIRNLALAQGASQMHVNARQVLETSMKHLVSVDGKLYAYPRASSRPMQSELELDGEFGWFTGIYLSEGNATKYYTSISNTNAAIQGKTRAFAGKHGFSINEYDNSRGFAPSHDMRINSTLLSGFLKAACGTSSYEKRVPEFAYCADEGFIGALLRGYFDGDGNVSVERKVIRASSKSKELIDGLCILLSRLGIYATKRPDEKSHNLSISYRYAARFLEKIGSDIPKKAAALRFLSDTTSEVGYNSVDVLSLIHI